MADQQRDEILENWPVAVIEAVSFSRDGRTYTMRLVGADGKRASLLLSHTRIDELAFFLPELEKHAYLQRQVAGHGELAQSGSVVQPPCREVQAAEVAPAVDLRDLSLILTTREGHPFSFALPPDVARSMALQLNGYLNESE